MSGSIRVSILLSYLRMFDGVVRHTRTVIFTLLALQATYGIFNCILQHLYFNNGYNYHLEVQLYAASLALDIFLIFLPLWPATKWRGSIKKQIGFAVIFVLGVG